MLELVFTLIVVFLAPILLNKIGKNSMNWLDPYYRELWTFVFVVILANSLNKPKTSEFIKKTHSHEVLRRHRLLEYGVIFVIGGLLLSGYWWFTGKISNSSTDKQVSGEITAQQEYIKIPTAKEIAKEIIKELPGLAPPKLRETKNTFNEKVENTKPQEPTFNEKLETVAVSLGRRGVTVGYELSQLSNGKVVEPANFGGYKPIRLYMDQGKLYADVSVYGGLGKPPIEVKHNQFVLRNPRWDRNFDSVALEIVDENKFPVFQLIYESSYHIVINGLFPSPSGLNLFGDTGFIGNATEIPNTFRIERLFKYPSSQFLSQREKTP